MGRSKESRIRRLLAYRKKADKLRRVANKMHLTYQSNLERESNGWMPQWIVNKILGRYDE